MGPVVILQNYILWHYSRSFVDLSRIWMNFLWFFYHFFSIPDLFRTWFLPWKRLQEPYKKGLDVGAFFSTLIVNILMRIVGFFARTVILLFGVLFITMTALLGAAVFLAWLLLPVVSIASFLGGLFLLFS